MSLEQRDMLIEIIRERAEARPKSVEALRQQIDETMSRVPPAECTRRETRVAGRRAVWFETEGASTEHAILYFHGGGYALGSADSHASLTSRLAVALEAPCLSFEYRLAPEHPHPAATDDCLAAYRWLLEEGVAPERIVIAGDSAGGGLVLATLLGAREAGLPLPACAMLFSPWTDLACEGASVIERQHREPMIAAHELPSFRHMYIGRRDPKLPLASPLYADLTGLPPLLIQVGTEEVLFDDSTRLHERAEFFDVDARLEIWDDMFHVWQLYAPFLDEAQHAIDQAAVFARHHWER